MLAILLSNLACFDHVWRYATANRLQRVMQRHRKALEAAKQWERVAKAMLSLSCNTIILCDLLEDCTRTKLSAELQKSLATALTRALDGISIVVEDFILRVLDRLASNTSFDSLHEDLKISIMIWLCRFAKGNELPERIVAMRDAFHQGNIMADGAIQATLADTSMNISDPQLGDPRRKRRKMAPETAQDQQSCLINRITKLLTGHEGNALTEIPVVGPNIYKTLREDQQCEVWQLLAHLCSIDFDVTYRLIVELLKVQNQREYRRQRVSAMLAVHACASVTKDPAILELSTTDFGRLCLSSLHSSIRELRVAAGHCLPHFLRADLSHDLKSKNRHTALEYLRRLSSRDTLDAQETVIGAWGQVALTCGEQELNLVLMQLVEYLGHSNSLISSTAFEEIESLAAAKEQTTMDLFRPFWSSVALSAVRDLHSRPQKVQSLCELLRIDIDRFLVLTQHYTIPTLVLTRKRDILQRIAAARGKGESIHQLCVQPATNLAAILALLLNQPVADPEEEALRCLSDVSPSFRGIDLTSLVKIDPVLAACEMLKQSGDSAENQKARSYRAIQIFANLVERSPGQSRGQSRSNKRITEFFDAHILGIMTHFSHVLEDVQEAVLISEKLRCVKGVRDMIHLTKSHASVALAQIKAFLQSAMERPALCEAAFSTWLALLSVLDPEDAGNMLDQTFALILQHWPQLSASTQSACQTKLSEFVKQHNKIVQEHIMTLPSLKGIELMTKLTQEIDRLRALETVENHFWGYERRLRDESMPVLQQALKELVPFLTNNQEFIRDAAATDQSVPALSALIRALLDITTKFSSNDAGMAELCGTALGIIGCLDPNRIEAPRKQKRMVVLSNFDKASETVDWVVLMLEDVLVKAFKSTTNARALGFLAYVLQELLKFCGFNDATTARTRSSQTPSVQQRWLAMPENVRIALTPFLNSRYVVTNSQVNVTTREYPGFALESGHSSWLRSLVHDLMFKGKGDNPKMVFPLLARTVRSHDLAIASFLLPYAILNVVLGGTVQEVRDIQRELMAVLECRPGNVVEIETAKKCSETVFEVLDYISSWLKLKKKTLAETRADAYRTGNSPGDFDEARDMAQIQEVEKFLSGIPAEVLATRAMECGSHARALFNWEQFIRQKRQLVPSPRMSESEEEMYSRLHQIYASIDEPDGLEGIGTQLSFLSEEQQAVQHTKAGRWTAAQAWYELQVTREPSDVETQMCLLNCFRETGQYAPLLRYAQSFLQAAEKDSQAATKRKQILPVALEAYWMTGDMTGLKRNVQHETWAREKEFNIGLGQALVASLDHKESNLVAHIASLRAAVTQGMTEARTSSLQASHQDLKKLHMLYEFEVLTSGDITRISKFLDIADKRLAALGSCNADKQDILGLRRAIMRPRPETFADTEIGRSWLTTARLARKAGNTHSAYDAVLQAYSCGDRAAKLEEARLLWHDGHQRQAIQALHSAIESGIFEGADAEMADNSESSERNARQNMLSARAQLLLAKWLDASGQSQTADMTVRYQRAAKNFQRWEKGHYYLGKHYNKLLEAEKALPKNKQTAPYLSGEMTKSVIENLLRSIPFGNKYWHETIPKILTLWLDLGLETQNRAPKEDPAIFEKRQKSLQAIHRQLQKYSERIPPYVFYSALPQLISRITHPQPEVWKQLASMITRIVSAYPNEALWALFPVLRATDRTRAERGQEIINRLKDPRSKLKFDSADIKTLILAGQRLCDGLLNACEEHVEPRKAHVSLSKDLKFNHKLAPSALVVPIEATLTASLPNDADLDKIRRHKGFTQDKVTIQSFTDEVLVLSSLQRPRKITVRGSDGRRYGLLCKPKDDLRKDQRLMEFNGIINRALKRDPESSKRRLYIKTYAVTPLSEESGTIEWVEGIKPIRDILLATYARKGVRPNYSEIKRHLEDAMKGPAYIHIFKDKVLSQFPPALHEWFTETYAEPDAWFAARLRYARSAAVMSMTGHILGLGDRHGENILLEEGTGGVFHVDFNCLFDKGLTFEKPELVPFRLTHNMVDAMGAYGYEGPFRKSCELTLALLRQNKDTLTTILETFVYDPTTDFVGKKKRTTAGVPETPQEILDSVEAKLKGLLRGENVPLGVEGYVDALIREAVSHKNLTAMYIGWCAFL